MPVESRAKPEQTGQTGWNPGLVASLTLLSCKLLSALRSCLRLFSSLLPYPPFFLYLLLFTSSFFLSFPFLYFSFIFGLSVSFFFFLSPPPLLPSSSFWRDPRAGPGSAGWGVSYFSLCVQVEVYSAEEGLAWGVCRGLWVWAWCASVQTRPRLRSRPDGGGLAFPSATAA